MRPYRLIAPRSNARAYRLSISRVKTRENAEPGNSGYTYAMLLICVKLSIYPPHLSPSLNMSSLIYMTSISAFQPWHVWLLKLLLTTCLDPVPSSIATESWAGPKMSETRGYAPSCLVVMKLDHTFWLTSSLWKGRKRRSEFSSDMNSNTASNPHFPLEVEVLRLYNLETGL